MPKLRLRKPSPALVISCLALFVALSGSSYAVIVLPKGSVGTKQLRSNAVKSSKIADNQVTGVDVNEATLGQVPSAANATSAQAADSAANADKLDGLDSASFLRINGKAADSEKLDGVDSTGFYVAGSKVADSLHVDAANSAGVATNADNLDNLDSLQFARSRIYVREMVSNGSANVNETCPDGALCFVAGHYCDPGDTLLGGGFDDLDGTRLVASEPFVPNPQDAWRVKIVNNSTEDTITVFTICADNGPVRVG